MKQAIKLLNSLRRDFSWRYRLAREEYFYIRRFKNWRAVRQSRRRQAALSRFEFRSSEVITFDGAPPWPTLYEIWRDHSYVPHEMRRNRNIQSIVDVGANIGFFSFYALHHWPNAHVFSFEPERINYSILVRNAALNPQFSGRLHLFQEAVASQSGNAWLHIDEYPERHRLLAEPSGSALQVPVVTLNDILRRIAAKRIDLLKLDCEGQEFDIIENAIDLMKSSVLCCVLEYHEHNGRRGVELIRLLTQHGFRVTLRSTDSHMGLGIIQAQNTDLSLE